MAVTVRKLSGHAEFAAAERVQKNAWGMSDMMVTPKELLIAMSSNGGLVLGAFDGTRMVGFSVAFPCKNNGRWYLYSHMTGVLGEYQSRGIGTKLKERQFQVALQAGYSFVAWTFDPLILRNAYFNFRKLSVVSRTYYVNYYGPMNDSINFGWETDRFLAERFLERGVLGRLRRESRSLEGAHPAIRTRRRDGQATCHDWHVDLGAPAVLVDIPRDMLAMKRSHPREAERWKLATREVFQACFRAGFTAVGLLDGEQGYSYLLKKLRLPRKP